MASLILAGVVVAACVGHERADLADGSRAYRIACNGPAHSMVDCLEQGDALCRPRSYRIFDPGGEEISLTQLMIVERISDETGIAFDRRIAVVCL